MLHPPNDHSIETFKHLLNMSTKKNTQQKPAPKSKLTAGKGGGGTMGVNERPARQGRNPRKK